MTGNSDLYGLLRSLYLGGLEIAITDTGKPVVRGGTPSPDLRDRRRRRLHHAAKLSGRTCLPSPRLVLTIIDAPIVYPCALSRAKRGARCRVANDIAPTSAELKESEFLSHAREIQEGIGMIELEVICAACGHPFTPTEQDIPAGLWHLCPPCGDGPELKAIPVIFPTFNSVQCQITLPKCQVESVDQMLYKTYTKPIQNRRELPIERNHDGHETDTG